jgi:hypothetical protein
MLCWGPVADLRDDCCAASRRCWAAGWLRLRQRESLASDSIRTLLARLLGPVIFRVAIQQVAADRDFIDRLVAAALGTAEGTGHGHRMTSE